MVYPVQCSNNAIHQDNIFDRERSTIFIISVVYLH